MMLVFQFTEEKSCWHQPLNVMSIVFLFRYYGKKTEAPNFLHLIQENKCDCSISQNEFLNGNKKLNKIKHDKTMFFECVFT